MIAILLGFSVAHAACDATVSGGRVTVSEPLHVGATLPPETAACLSEIGSQLAATPGLRTVTVAVRLPADRRGAGEGPKIGAAYTAALAEGGLSPARISAVSPAGDTASVSLSYSEKRGANRVAMAEGVSGQVKVGPSADALQPIGTGAMLNAGTWVETGSGSAVALSLLDGSRLRLGADTLLFVGALTLDEQLGRQVELELVRGDVEAHASEAAGGSKFDIKTQTGVAGVRGTRFRVALEDGGVTRLETLDGGVNLAGDKADVDVNRGFGSRVDTAGTPEPPTALPLTPRVDAPIYGEWVEGTPMTWRPVRGVDGYVVQIARDAEFAVDVQVWLVDDASLTPDDLDPGQWFWRVSATDPTGFSGDWSRVYGFDLIDE